MLTCHGFHQLLTDVFFRRVVDDMLWFTESFHRQHSNATTG
ncbi:hypothetical protein Bhyg_05678 [Pseudolycoriella hygida]|uniref:Uncharacterized protein n=1 Tax=Pseudolycoriella hygida TaxID=35572 RepID=A0A9Q0N0P7_9DIPT|nr:hypothetical protein Bhyg_05678 [Pseudolycoriella hygida]